MKNSILFSIIFLFSVSFSFAGDGISKGEQMQMIKGRPLLVEIPSIDTEYIEKLKKKDKTYELEDYTKHYKEFVENYKKAFKEFWILNKEIQFKTSEEMLDIINQNTDKFAIIRYIENEAWGLGYKPLNSVTKYSNYIFLNKSKFATLNLYLSESQPLILTCRLPYNESEAGIVYTIRQFDFASNLIERQPTRKLADIIAFNYYEYELNVPRVKTSIFYIKNEDISDELTIEKITKYYKGEFKIVTNKEWENAILEKNPKVICFILLPGNTNSAIKSRHDPSSAENNRNSPDYNTTSHNYSTVHDCYHMFFCADNCGFLVNIPGQNVITVGDLKILSKMAK